MSFRYRPNVGMMIVNADKKVLMGVRVHSEGQVFRMQMPQGGIDKGETPLVAVYREMKEEIGLNPSDVRLLATSRNWYKYDLPDTPKRKRSIRGQRQKWFLFLLKSNEDCIDLKCDVYQEFSSYEWVDINRVSELVIPFKRDVYIRVLDEFEPIIQTLDI